MPPSHRTETVLRDDDLTVKEHTCRGHGPDWVSCSPLTGHAVALVRRGAFRRRVLGTEALVDPGVAFFHRPGDEEEVAHPIEGGDDDTIVALSPEAVDTLRGLDGKLPSDVVFTTPEDQLRHRILLAACRRGESANAQDHAVALAASVLHRAEPFRVRSLRPSTLAARNRVVDTAREALVADPSLTLLQLARVAAVSPYHLSRIFREVAGQTLSAYRRRLRIGYALERLGEGDQDLAAVAAETGFSDHAHLTRTFRQELGEAPSHIRRLIAPILVGSTDE